MKKFASTIAVVALVMGMAATAADAQAFSPKVPNPSDPFPEFPIATNGTPLPSQADNGPINGAVGAGGLYTGRSAAVGGPLGFVGNIVGAGVNTAGAAVGAGLGVAGAAVGAGY